MYQFCPYPVRTPCTSSPAQQRYMILMVLTPSMASAEETSELQYNLPCELAHAASVSGSRRRPGQTALRAHERELGSRYTELTPRTYPLSRARFHRFWVPLRGMGDCSEFWETLAVGGVKCLRLPPRSPN